MAEPKLTTRDRALDLAASIVEARAAEVESGYVRWREKYSAYSTCRTHKLGLWSFQENGRRSLVISPPSHGYSNVSDGHQRRPPRALGIGTSAKRSLSVRWPLNVQSARQR